MNLLERSVIYNLQGPLATSPIVKGRHFARKQWLPERVRKVRGKVHYCQRSCIPSGFVWNNNNIQWLVKLATDVFSRALSKKIYSTLRLGSGIMIFWSQIRSKQNCMGTREALKEFCNMIQTSSWIRLLRAEQEHIGERWGKSTAPHPGWADRCETRAGADWQGC